MARYRNRSFGVSVDRSRGWARVAVSEMLRDCLLRPCAWQVGRRQRERCRASRNRTPRSPAGRQRGRLRCPFRARPIRRRRSLASPPQASVWGLEYLSAFSRKSGSSEVWVEKDGAYASFATYPICFVRKARSEAARRRSATPRVYTITDDQMHFGDRWQRSLDIGYPNTFDHENGRTGSLILVHGGCDSMAVLP